MLRKLNKEMRNEFFQQIAMKLVRKDIEEYESSKKPLGDLCHQDKYRKHLKLMSQLPSGFLPTKGVVKLEGISLPEIYISNISDYFMPVKSSNKYGRWECTSEEIYTSKQQLVSYNENYRIYVTYKELPKSLQNKLIKKKKEGLALISNTTKLLSELKNVLNRCKTVKELREILPEFNEFYPSDSVDNLPVPMGSINTLKAASQTYAEKLP